MMTLLTPLLDWLAIHPHWAGLAVFLIALAESLALVGLFMPGALLMFGIGALVATGTLALWPTLAWAAAGAVLGDAISFWLGHHFRQQLLAIWPFSRYPQLIERATQLFQNHGGKAILLGRFIGPIRPVIPAVAGMLGMRWSRFLPFNLLSALLWAPAYIIPGMVFAVSLELAAAVAARLAVTLVGLLLLLFLVAALARWLFHQLHPHTHTLLRHALQWGERHPHMGHLSAALFDPEHPEARGFTLLTLILLLATALFVALLQATMSGLLVQLDSAIYQSLQALRTPWMDQLQILITELGDGYLLTSIFLSLLCWLLLRRHWLAIGHWLSAGLFVAIAPPLLKWLTQLDRPQPLYDGLSNFSFPSGHAVGSSVIFGFIAILWAGELRIAWRWLPYAIATVIATAIGFSRIYLGAHWLSDVIAGLALGGAWVALLGIAYHRHQQRSLPRHEFAIITLLLLPLLAAGYMVQQIDADQLRYRQPHISQQLMLDSWWQQQWQALPQRRDDRQQQRLHLQYVGDKRWLQQQLIAGGWQQATPLTTSSWLRWLNPVTPLPQRPLLPQVHQGQHEALRLIRADTDGNFQLLRLWRSTAHLQQSNTPIWLGNLSELQPRSLLLGLLTLTQQGSDSMTAVKALAEALRDKTNQRWVGSDQMTLLLQQR